MLIDLDTFVILAYAGTMLAALVAEFWPRREIARRASLLAVALALTGGAAWGYAVIKRGYIFYPRENAVVSRKGSGGEISFWGGSGKGGGRSVIIDRAGGGEPNLEDGQGAEDGGGGSWTSRIVTSALGDGSGASLSLGSLLGGGAPKGREPSDIDGEVKKDCEDCPEMLVISGGSSVIGAPDNDGVATAAERPPRLVRLWPGFAISRYPISASQYEAARKALELPQRDCGAPPVKDPQHAVCITAEDAAAYAAWLTQRSGKRYRLATAIEWEFAARTRGTTAVADASLSETDNGAVSAPPLAGIGQDLSELTADCFDPYVPSEGKERYAWNTDPKLCETRVLKGASVGEDRVFARFSARRAWNAEEARWTVGFRVVRDRH